MTQIRRSIPANAMQLRRLSADIEEWLRTCEDDAELVHRATVVLEEVVGNIVEHAFDPGEFPEIGVRVRHEEGHVEFEISDPGPEFDPWTVESPSSPSSLADAAASGRGIDLVRQWAKSVRHERRNGQNHVHIVLAKK